MDRFARHLIRIKAAGTPCPTLAHAAYSADLVREPRLHGAMLRFVRALGFEIAPEPHAPAMVRIVKDLRVIRACA